MANTERAKFFSKVKKNTKASWKDARKVKAIPVGQGLPPGLKNAIAEFSEYKLAESKKGDPYVSLTGLVVEPENCAGRRVTRTYYLADNDWTTAEQNLEKLAKESKLMGASFEEDSSEEDWPDVFDELVAAKSRYYFHTGEFNGKTTILLQGPVEDGEEETTSDDDDEEVFDGGDQDEEDEIETPEEGDAVLFKPARKRSKMEMTVVSVSEDGQTVSLEDENEKTYTEVPWSKIEFVLE